MKKRILLLIFGLFILTGCDIIKSESMKDIDIYTTTYPVSYIINYLYGDNANIYSIYPSGVNFNDYELSEKKLYEFAKSDLFVFNSQDIDRNYAVDMLNINKDLKLIDEALNMNYTYAIEELWLNPYNYLMMAKNTLESLSEYINDPYLVKDIEDKYETLQYDLSKMDANYKETFKDQKYNIIVADNDLFKFLEKYDVEVISLEEEIVSITISEEDTLSDIAKKYNVTGANILTYNNIDEDLFSVGLTIKIPVKTVETSTVSRVKKLISEGTVKYIYSDSDEMNSVVASLVSDNKDLEVVKINTMYSIDGGITNNNENYFTVMNNNLELFKLELDK